MTKKGPQIKENDDLTNDAYIQNDDILEHQADQPASKAGMSDVTTGPAHFHNFNPSRS